MPMADPPRPLPAGRLLFSLDPAVAYLDHAAFGAVPLPVQRAQRRLREEMEANPARFLGTGIRDRLAHVRRHLAGFLGADPDGSALVANVDVALTCVLRSMRLRPGDEVVTTDHGSAATAVAVEQVCRQAGAVSRTAHVPLSARPDEVVAAVRDELTDRTRLVVVEQITASTAKLLPVGRLVREVRARGAAVFVDGRHAPGVLDAPVDQLRADFWAGDLHTWAYAPRPTALLVVDERWRDAVRPLVPLDEEAAGFPSGLEWQGTLDYTPWLASPTGPFTLRSIGVDVVRGYNASLAAYGQRVLAEALDADMDRLSGSCGPVELPIRVLELPDGVAATAAAARALRQEISDELAAEVTVTSWRGLGLLRLSAQVYNRPEEYERLASDLPALLRRR